MSLDLESVNKAISLSLSLLNVLTAAYLFNKVVCSMFP